MTIKVSGCYYHVDEPAVATCTLCGVGICRRCAVKDDSGRVICCQCGNKQLKEEHKMYKASLKQKGGKFVEGKEFIKPGIVGLIILLFGIYANVRGTSPTEMVSIANIIAYILLSYFLFSIPYGMVGLSDIFSPKYESLHDHSFKWVIKLFVAIPTGWIFLTFYIIRYIILKIRKKK